MDHTKGATSSIFNQQHLQKQLFLPCPQNLRQNARINLVEINNTFDLSMRVLRKKRKQKKTERLIPLASKSLNSEALLQNYRTH